MANAKPRLSVIVIAYRMRRQAMNTLYSLSCDYQQHVSPADYEVIVVENSSEENLTPADVTALGPNFSYHRREETRPTPVYAINEAVALAQSDHLCLMIDGARMVTPRVIDYSLRALAMYPHGLVAVPGYHLGDQDQRYSSSAGHTPQAEQAMLERVDWTHHGYRLFDISVISGANTHGVFHPLMECNCLSFHRDDFAATGGADEGFQSPGGGSINLDIYRNLARLPHCQLIVLPGEGSFHQYHGGVTTREAPDLEEVWAAHREEFKRVRGEYYQAVLREPVQFGSVTSHAVPFLLQSSEAAQRRFARFRWQQQNPWADDPELNLDLPT